MNKKTYTVLFTIVSTIANIILTFLIIALLLLGVSAFYFKVLGKTTPGTGLAILWMISFVAGLILGMFLFSKLGSWVIDRFNLATKLDPKILGKYLPSGKKNLEYIKEMQKKPKTNIPRSTLAVEDEMWANDIKTGISASNDDDDDSDDGSDDDGNGDDSES